MSRSTPALHHYTWWLLLLLLALVWADQQEAYSSPQCPQQCGCSAVKIRGGDSGVRVRCPPDISPLKDIAVLNQTQFPNDTILLDLSGNELTTLKKGQLDFLPKLQKLVLANNNLSHIEGSALTALGNLHHLDLSGNHLSVLSNQTWAGLTHLQRLKLTHNRLSRLEEATFAPLVALQALDLSNNPLICDCELAWLVRGELSPRGRCELPLPLAGTSLKRLQSDTLHCRWPLQLPVFQLRPSGTQVVFAGDSLRISCKVSTEDDVGVTWGWRKSPEAPLEQVSGMSQVTVEAKRNSDESLTSLIIRVLDSSHSGEWMCVASSSRGNTSRQVSLVVLSPDVPYCMRSSTSGGRGHYEWPEVVGGVQAKLPCQVQSSVRGGQPSWASRQCSGMGNWEAPMMEDCAYERETARLLHQMAQAHTESPGHVSPSLLGAAARQLHDASSDLHGWEELALASRAGLRLATALTGSGGPEEEAVAAAITDLLEQLSTSVMELDLKKAQLQDNACSRLISTAEIVAKAIPSFKHHGSQLVLDVVNGGVAVSCVWLSLPPARVPDRLFHCTSEMLRGVPSLAANEQVEAWIRVPAVVPSHNLAKVLTEPISKELSSKGLPSEQVSDRVVLEHVVERIAPERIPALIPEDAKLVLAAFADGALFPGLPDGTHRVSGVVGCSTGADVDLKDGVLVTLRTNGAAKEVARWDSHAGWVTGEQSRCRLIDVAPTRVQFQCWKLGYYTVLAPVLVSKPNMTAMPVVLHPGVYVGSAMCATLLVTAILTQIWAWKSSGLSRRLRHALINGWLSITVLQTAFCFGTVPVQQRLPCGLLGLALHYLTLCSLLWILLAIHCLKGKVSRENRKRLGNVTPDEDDIGLGPKPGRMQRLVQLYLLGWGPGLLAVGLTGAVHLPEYSSGTFCFLRPSVWPGAVWLPLAILCLLTCLHAGLAHRAINVQKMLNSGSTWSPDSTSLRSSTSSLVPDMTKTPTWCLKALEIQAVLFWVAWLSGVASVCPSALLVPSWRDLADLFPVVFCVTSGFLGGWVVAAWCCMRKDIRKAMSRLCRGRSGRREEGGDETFRTLLTQPDTPDGVEMVVAPQKQAPPLPALPSHTTTDADDDKSEAPLPQPQLLEASNGYLSCESVPESFYNPYQSGIARRFFEKQRLRSERHSEGESPSHHHHHQHRHNHPASDGASETDVPPIGGQLYRGHRRGHSHQQHHRPRRKGGGGRVVAGGGGGDGDASPGWTNKETCV